MLRSTLLKLSESKGLANWVVSNPSASRTAHRFVAGETLDQAIAAARECNNAGMLTSLDYLGENVATTADAQRARDAYLEIFDRIAKEQLHANVSCKLTQMGLDLSVEFCEGLVLSVVMFGCVFGCGGARPPPKNIFLRVEEEDAPTPPHTEKKKKTPPPPTTS